MIRTGLTFAAALLANPATAQMHDMHMPGMTMPARPVAKKPAPAPPVAVNRPPLRASAEPAHDLPMTTSPQDDAPIAPIAPTAIQPQDEGIPATRRAGNAPAPPVPTDHYADRAFAPDAMAAARRRMMREMGGQRFAMIMFNLAEFQARRGSDGYRWDGEGWFGGDLDRVVVKTEGSGDGGRGVEAAEAQLLYSRAIGPYYNLQAGVRHDFQPSPTRTYATIGVEGLAPYMFQTEAALFVSTQGDVFARAEGWYDQRLSQRLVLQPRVELNLAAQNMPSRRIGAGLSDAELGLRLRYEIDRRFAPYIGISYDAKTGKTADYARAIGDDPTTTNFVAGVRFWF